jgi:peptidoglycan hydrolase-like protein with peptidoglycan-binding domain
MGDAAHRLTKPIAGVLCFSLLGAAAWPLPVPPSVMAAPLVTSQTKQIPIDIELSRRTLQRGNQGDDVIALQRMLDRQGFYTGAFDGVYGPDTEQAVREFQQRAQLPVTGVADSGTLDALGFILPGEALAPTPTPSNFVSETGTLTRTSLVPGNSGDDVATLQRALNSNGANLAVDGLYGPATTQAVQNFQQRQRLPVTGEADSRTLEALGFRSQRNRYIAGITTDTNQLDLVRQIFPNAQMDSLRQGNFINIGSYPNRAQATERVNAARARGFDARVLYR